MRSLKPVVAVCLIVAVLASQPGSAQVSVTIGFNTFQTGLSPYGQWVSVSNYGTVWAPTVAATWRPYTAGHWVYSDVGWVWMSAEPWGWATYHYGRWVYDPNFGWCWVPGAVWAPAWVSWYVGPNYIGWYPMGPPGYPAPRPAYVSFVPFRSFLSVNLAGVMLPPGQNVTIIRNTALLNNITVVNNNTTIINPGPSVGSVQQATGQPVPQVNVVSRGFNANRLATSGIQANQLQGNTLYAYRPSVQPPPPGTSAPLLQNESRGQVWLGNHNATLRTFPSNPSQPTGNSWHSATQPAPNLRPQFPTGSYHPPAPGYAPVLHSSGPPPARKPPPPHAPPPHAPPSKPAKTPHPSPANPH